MKREEKSEVGIFNPQFAFCQGIYLFTKGYSSYQVALFIEAPMLSTSQ